MRWIGRFLSGLWGISRRSWVTVDSDLRPRSPASGLYLFLFLLFFIIGLVLVLLGVDLDRLDLWIEAQGGWLDALGSALFRVFCGLILAVCAFAVVGGVAQRIVPSMQGEDRIGIGMMIGAALVGYFAWFGVVG
jgi:uncharacterized membrane protein YraQ (UPF0718 family)